MTSLLTNVSAMTAIASLTATQKSLAKVQKQIATGLAVNDASDNPAIWSLATGMRTDVAALTSVGASINVGSAIISTATPAMNAVLNLLQTVRSQLSNVVAPSGNGSTISAATGFTLGQIQSNIAAAQQSIVAIMGSTSAGGVNMLDGSQASVNIVDSYARNSGGTNYGSLSIASSVTALGGTAASAPSGTTGGGGLLGASLTVASAAGTAGSTSSSGGTFAGTYASDSLLAFSLSSTTKSTDFAAISQALDAAIAKVTNSSAQLASYGSILSSQSTAVSTLTDNINAGIGSLVDADMNVASSRLQALQVQQQLGIQALSIANSNSQLILKLFGD